MSDLAIYNAKVYIGREDFCQAVLIKDGLIAAVGSDSEILSRTPKGARIYDAGKRTVIPGFNDSHLHLLNVGETLSCIRLQGADSIAEVKRRIGAFIEKTKPAQGTVLHGTGWNQDLFKDEKRLLTRYDLDEAGMGYPLILERACGHILTADSLALGLAGITGETVPPEGGAIDLDENGEPTGVIRENACYRILRLLPKDDPEAIEKKLRIAMAYAAECGVTSVQTMDMRPGKWRETLEVYKRVQADKPTLRAYQQVNFMEPGEFKEFLEEGYRTGMGDRFLKIGPLKMFLDGSLGARTAFMREPYRDDPSNRGILTMDPETLGTMTGLAEANGCTAIMHAIGDGAVDMALKALETVIKGGENKLRHGIVHCQITDRGLLERFAKSDILAYVQPVFLDYDLTVLRDRVGERLASESYAFNTLKKLGVHESFGTDSPVEDMDPIRNLYCAVMGKGLAKRSGGDIYPDEAMDIYDAVDAYTSESAYASFEENIKGRIRLGYYGDLCILDGDIFECSREEISNIKVEATILEGRFVYER